MARLKWEQKHIDFLKRNADGNNSEKLTKAFNKKFGTNQSKASLKCQMYANGIKFNTNIGGFQKGQRSHNTYPIGAKSVDKDGFVIYKHSNSGGHHSKNWKLYHHFLWEQEYGKIPEKHVVIFLNGDNRDFRIENLFCVERGVWLKVIYNNMRFDDPELVGSAIHLGRLMLKQKKLEKRRRK
ncbi:HNH endonuclease signature motif containing protein [Staphylococcus haemolyticus]|uniref:HNH endonuclease signature motif containing protein n=1 Tax=Staphylococcus haemolyticus TaxID=1283 RepID=UPI001F0A50E2|nr:HNH endonuclease signature motif containing protein [Staphylococcus haemolyticus]MCH4489306.1 HNH endonuclease [Staphylococcus haemolyticus]